MPELAISPEKLAFIIEKAREFDVKEGNSDVDSGSNAADDDMIDVLEDNGQDPVVRELTSFIGALNEDEQTTVIHGARRGRAAAARTGVDGQHEGLGRIGRGAVGCREEQRERPGTSCRRCAGQFAGRRIEAHTRRERPRARE